MSAMLEVDDLRAGYGDHEILRGVHLRADAGEIVAIIGPNGAGKSTLLKTIAGLLTPRGGDLRFRGEPIGGSPPAAIIGRGLCYVPPEANVFASLSVEENLTIGAWAAGARPRERARSVVELFPVLGARRRQRAGSLSGGEQQMLTIARTLMGGPEVLLLDEPFEGLAPLVVEMLAEQLGRLKAQGLTMVVTEQNARFVSEFGDRVYVLERGTVCYCGTMSEFLRDDDVRRAYLAV